MTFDITTLSDQGFYGEQSGKPGYYATTIENTKQAAAKVWQSVLDNTVPEDDDSIWRRNRSYFEQTPFADLAEGDLLAVTDMATDKRTSLPMRPSVTRNVTLAGWVGAEYRSASLVVVVKRTAKQVQVKPVPNPAQWYGYDFNFTSKYSDDYIERWGDSSSRFVVRLGSREEIAEAVAKSPAFPRWERVHAAAVAAAAENERRRDAQAKADKEAHQAAVEPFKAPTKTLNKALGFKVFTYDASGIERASAFKRVPTEALVLMLQGRVATGTVAKHDHQAVLDLLTGTAVV